MLLDNIQHIQTDLKKYSETTPEELLKFCIRNKLLDTLKRYGMEIEANADYLLTRSSIKVLKALTKIQKNDDKQFIEEQCND